MKLSNEPWGGSGCLLPRGLLDLGRWLAFPWVSDWFSPSDLAVQVSFSVGASDELEDLFLDIGICSSMSFESNDSVGSVAGESLSSNVILACKQN